MIYLMTALRALCFISLPITLLIFLVLAGSGYVRRHYPHGFGAPCGSVCHSHRTRA